MFNTSVASTTEYSAHATTRASFPSGPSNVTTLDGTEDTSYVTNVQDQLSDRNNTTKDLEVLSGHQVSGDFTSGNEISTNDSELSWFTTDFPTYKISEDITKPQPSFEAFVPLTDLGLQTTELIPNDSSNLLDPDNIANYTWNKAAGFNITFNFTGNLSVSDWNTTETSQHHSINWLLLVLCIIPTWILFGNLLVLLAVIYHRNLRTLSNLVIASLAVTDFLLALIVVPFGTYQVVSE